ncbi:50S ribosomal protein L15 [Candidatus Falkowbacteria bacterium CG11_big_fil_rev_8_21_14_0_20_39_10]|uniref:Large ribosomal subunit protein uL15 n=1 Tax=Candidatus Falkowbacteria bacterium CG11_big_fil_rev_8_21_14_0_20_39_10 TaxID=1974570 RepID=A0A2M6K986_9BACT|nr:MAG: 50S ribosomal protein L15 [Candidatus Falkowbacteria bacterium CG11_big_fil_rev_8_21_14_0_20_39_10]
MTLSLHTIKKSGAVKKKRKRIGRGNASGHGTYSGRGQKGQKSRAGVSRLKLKKIGAKRGRSAWRGVPKLRGFKSDKPQNQVVKIIDINKNFKDNEIVNPKILLKKGIIDRIELPIKILGKGKLTVKGLKFEGVKMSEGVRKNIEAKSNLPADKAGK